MSTVNPPPSFHKDGVLPAVTANSISNNTTTLPGNIHHQALAINKAIGRDEAAINLNFASTVEIENYVAKIKMEHSKWLGQNSGALLYTNNWLITVGGTLFFGTERNARTKNENYERLIALCEKELRNRNIQSDANFTTLKNMKIKEVDTLTGGGNVQLPYGHSTKEGKQFHDVSFSPKKTTLIY